MAPRRRRYRYRLLLDENFPSRKKLFHLNNRHNVKHIHEDYGLSGISDEEVCKRAKQEQRVVVTFNIKHFRGKEKMLGAGVIGVSPNLVNDQIDKKLSSLLSETTPNRLKGTFHYISREKK